MIATRLLLTLTAMAAGTLLFGQAADRPANSFEALRFLEGTWDAKTAAGANGPAVSGTYTFRKELDGHILARHSSSDACKAPADFDCDHHDFLYVFQNAADQPLQAIYFDNEGHVIHYDVFATSATSIAFVSNASVPGPRFRLSYELHEGIMSGKFQLRPPGQTEWKSYLEWGGSKR